MKKRRLSFLCGWFLAASFAGLAQRNYAPASVLATGNWYKLGVTKPGVYKIDLALLNSMGINTANLICFSPMYGNGVNARSTRPVDDDLQERS
jgi:hypothetical protein